MAIILVEEEKTMSEATFNKMLAKNPLKTRTDVIEAILQLVRPLKAYYSEGNAWLHIGNTGAHYGEKSIRMEGFARVMWAMGPLFSADLTDCSEEIQLEAKEWLKRCKEGIINGTNPNHLEYWGALDDYDQKMVEMAALVTSLCLAKEKLWDALTEVERTNLYQWLNQINEYKVHPNNWRFFRILVNMTFQILGCSYSEERLIEDFNIIDKCYMGDGWYFDGNSGQVDYYIPFAMHYYGLIYAKSMEQLDTDRSSTFKKYAASFSKDFIYWFAKDGSEIPFGRSLTYRFAHSAFFSAMVFADVENGINLGVAKRTILGNLRQWFAKPIFDGAGILSIGYGYPNLIMSERYNAPGSPYWALKAFLILAIPKEHRFWQVEEEAFQYDTLKRLLKPHMLITHNEETNHVMAFPVGQHCMNHGNSPAKYEKFVYSNQFGFSVSRGSTLEDGAFDNTLAVSRAGENLFKMRYGVETFEVDEDYTYSKYKIMTGVEIESYIIPFVPWHLRIHLISNDYEIDIADGGFAIGIEDDLNIQNGRESGEYKSEQVIEFEEDNMKGLVANLSWGISGAIEYFSTLDSKLSLVQTFPNTNLFTNTAILPTVKRKLKSGTHVMITGFLGEKGDNMASYLEEKPFVRKKEGNIEITYKGKVVKIPCIKTC